MDVATSSGRRTWRESRRRCCREAERGRGCIDAARVDRRRRRRRRMLPSSDEFHHLGSAFVCCPPRTSFTIWDRNSFGREEEDEEDDSDGLREKNNDKGTMTTTNDCSGHERHNDEGRWNWNIIAIGRRRRWHGRTSRRLPPRPVVGRHHSREEGCGSETLSSRGGADAAADDGASEDGWFRMNVPPLII
jgi:hypothetical protein